MTNVRVNIHIDASANFANMEEEPTTNNGKEKSLSLEYLGRMGITAVAFPFEYVKVLIQLGHEPLPPTPTRTFFGTPALALPGAWAYMKYIKRVDGFWGLYRGLGLKLCTNIISGVTFTVCMDKLPSTEENEEQLDEDELTEEQKVTRFVHRTVREMLSRCAAILASHPFHVITIRTMAQFVGREEKYSFSVFLGMFTGLIHVYKDNGWKGFFAGLVPRLIGEVLTLWFAHVAAFVINTFIVEDKSLKSYVGASVLYIANVVTYPFTLVSNIMTINSSGLVAGMPPAMPLYIDWTDCWRHLSAMGQLKRGSSILWRYYTGPFTLDRDGRPTYVQRGNFRTTLKKQ